MKLKTLFVAVLAIAGLPFASTLPAATTVVGTGGNISYAVIQAEEFGAPLIFEYHYTYDSENPFDSYALFNFIDDAVVGLSLAWSNFGDEEDPNWFLDAITYNSITLTSAWPAAYWGQWVAGGQSGFPDAEPIPEGVWESGSGFSAPYRLVEPGSWDGVIFSETISPPVSPVPEPASWLLAAIGAALLVLRARKSWHGGASV